MTPWRGAAPPHADPWRDWLTYRGSLTRRIVERSAAFRVEVVAQGLRRPHEDEYRALGLRGRTLAHVREVLLHADGRPVVVGHSIVSAHDLRGPWRPVAGLGTRPLAAVLFADPRVRRRPFQYARLDARHPLARRAAAIAGTVPGGLRARRSVFRLHGRPVMVTEVFLPALLELGR